MVNFDGSHMLAAAPMGHTAGLLTKAHIVVPYVLSVNGAGITMSNEVWEKMKPNVPMSEGKPVHPIKADALKPVVEEFKNDGRAFKMAMTYPVGTHNYVLRYWLAAGGVHPGMYTSSDTDFLVLTCDMPQLDADVLKRLLRHYHASKQACFYSSKDSHIEPFPGIYLSEHRWLLEKRISENKLSMKGFIESMDNKNTLLFEANPKKIMNVNTIREWELLNS